MLTNDEWVLDTVSGYHIQFDQKPFQRVIPKETSFNEEQHEIVDNEVKKLHSIGAIVPCCHEKDEYISTIFIVPKPNGKFRPVINLRFLNHFVHYDHFKQGTFKVVLDLLQKDDYMTSVDMEQAYVSISIRESHQKYLKFSWNQVLYKLTCLGFGLKSAPFGFTKVLKAVFTWFRQ